MASYNVFLKEVPVHEWTAEGGTDLEILGREVLEPTQPATALKEKTGLAGKKIEAKLQVPSALKTELEGGGKVTALTVHFSGKAGSEAKAMKFAVVSPAVISEPAITIAQAWYTLSLTKAQAEALTLTTLEALTLQVERLTGTANLFEIYVSLEAEASGGTPVTAKAAGMLLLTGAAKGIAAQEVIGKATGPMLLAGTATGSIRAVVAGKASGALLLSGTAKGQAAGAIFGKASGAILLTGVAKGQVAGALQGKASGAIRLTGTATGAARAIVKGQAAGVLSLTGTAHGTVRAVVTSAASGAIVLTGSAHGTVAGGVVVGKATGALVLTGKATSTSGTSVHGHITIVHQRQALITFGIPVEGSTTPRETPFVSGAGSSGAERQASIAVNDNRQALITIESR